jgi:hypothetical protein
MGRHEQSLTDDTRGFNPESTEETHEQTSLNTPQRPYRRVQRHPDGEKDPWGRDLDKRIVLTVSAWQYAGTGHATTAERQLALAAAARAREHDLIAREELLSA